MTEQEFLSLHNGDKVKYTGTHGSGLHYGDELRVVRTVKEKSAMWIYFEIDGFLRAIDYKLAELLPKPSEVKPKPINPEVKKTCDQITKTYDLNEWERGVIQKFLADHLEAWGKI